MPKLTKIEGFDNKQMSESFLPPRRSRVSILPWILLLIVIAGAGVFAYQQMRESKNLAMQLKDLKDNPQKINEEETKVLLDKVGALIELPAEQPTVATVSDLAPLKDQPFFANAQIGDKVLIFSQARKAVLYRPSTNKVIEVAPVNLDNPETNVNTNAKSTNSNKNTNSSSNSNTNTSSNSNTNSSSRNSNTNDSN